ncbi:hypothetical protein, partial [uncultured Victivallis sp.]|uniref:hypothetical protein n=1 Tax=uncultured Victivallis sp. TaxID=354118 RepID=UPI0025E4EB32
MIHNHGKSIDEAADDSNSKSDTGSHQIRHQENLAVGHTGFGQPEHHQNNASRRQKHSDDIEHPAQHRFDITRIQSHSRRSGSRFAELFSALRTNALPVAEMFSVFILVTAEGTMNHASAPMIKFHFDAGKNSIFYEFELSKILK